jgi:LemA protein
MSKMSEKSQIERMVDEGKLTVDEANRLQHSLDEQAGRADILDAAPAGRRASKRKLTVFFGACLAFFLLGGTVGWVLTPALGPIPTTVPPSVGTQPGRVVDLSALSDERRKSMNQSVKLSSGVAIAVVVAVIGLLVAFLYNGLIDARERVNAAWAQVENVYQRRLDLVPVLIDGVKTYMDHERATLEELTEARAKAVGVQSALQGQGPDTAEQMKTLETTQGRVESALARLFAVVENYPDLKASENFLTLQDQIEGTENRVAVERRRYNEFSRRYNAMVLKFPHNLVAAAIDFEHKPYFQAEEKALQGLADPFGRATDKP